MNPLDHRLDRLLRSAALSARPASAELTANPEPPFGFETRVLAAIRASGTDTNPTSVFGAVFRRALVGAGTLMLFSIGLSYGALTEFAAVLHEPEVQAMQLTRSEVSASLDFAR